MRTTLPYRVWHNFENCWEEESVIPGSGGVTVHRLPKEASIRRYGRYEDDVPYATFNHVIGSPDFYTVHRKTGLLDSNKKEIFEGDICRAYKANSYLNSFYVVAWNEKRGRWIYKDDTRGYQVGSSGNLKCKVVGNVMDNKDLLFI